MAVRFSDVGDLFADFAFDPLDAHVGIEEEGGGVAFELEHPLIAEEIVFDPVAGEVGVLDGVDPQDLRSIIELVVGEVREPLLHDSLCLGDRFEEQVDQFFRLAGAGLEFLPVGAEHDAEGDVVDSNLGGVEVAGFFCSLEEHFEVEALSGVGEIDDPSALSLPGSGGGSLPYRSCRSYSRHPISGRSWAGACPL